MSNQRLDSSRTHVICPADDPLRVVGYHALTVAGVQRESAPGTVTEGIPPRYSIPVVLLARLAVHVEFQPPVRRIGLGQALLTDALIRTVRAADEIGIRAMLVDAIDERAADWYRRFGFEPSPTSDMQLFLPIARIRASLAATGADS